MPSSTVRAALPLALVLAAACARARTEDFSSPPLVHSPPSRDSVVAQVRAPVCGAQTLVAAFARNVAAATWQGGGKTCSAWLSVEMADGDSAVTRVGFSDGTTRIPEHPLVVRRGLAREHDLGNGVRMTVSIREPAP